jgi:hypothetical protein
MKQNLSIIIFQLGLFLILFGCQDISNPAISVLKVTLSEDFSIRADSATSPSDSAVFVSTQKFDANSNTDFLSNRSKMTEIEVEKLKYLIKEVAPGTADSLLEGRFEFLNPVTGQYETLAEDLNRKLYNGLEVQIPVRTEASQNLIAIFKSSVPTVEIRMKGKMNKRPINLIIAPQIQLSLKVKI